MADRALEQTSIVLWRDPTWDYSLNEHAELSYRRPIVMEETEDLTAFVLLLRLRSVEQSHSRVERFLYHRYAIRAQDRIKRELDEAKQAMLEELLNRLGDSLLSDEERYAERLEDAAEAAIAAIQAIRAEPT
jgi:hypothetical protein